MHDRTVRFLRRLPWWIAEPLRALFKGKPRVPAIMRGYVDAFYEDEAACWMRVHDFSVRTAFPAAPLRAGSFAVGDWFECTHHEDGHFLPEDFRRLPQSDVPANSEDEDSEEEERELRRRYLADVAEGPFTLPDPE